MTLKEIKDSVNSGRTVHWSNNGYRVICDGIGQWMIVCDSNQSAIGLTWRDNITINGKPEDFYLALPTPHQVAIRFTAILRELLNDDDLTEIDRLNRTAEYLEHNLCASHDYCDPNQAMIDALADLDVEFDTQDEQQGALIDKAWELAKQRGFCNESSCSV